jgi:hypothetical protein
VRNLLRRKYYICQLGTRLYALIQGNHILYNRSKIREIRKLRDICNLREIRELREICQIRELRENFRQRYASYHFPE